jgi:hypothetical protein
MIGQKFTCFKSEGPYDALRYARKWSLKDGYYTDHFSDEAERGGLKKKTEEDRPRTGVTWAGE